MLEILTLEQSEKWDSIVKSFKEHDIYWLSGYVKAFKLHGDGEPLLFYYDDSFTRGINVVMKRDISKTSFFDGIIPEGQYYDFATPYGYGGWIIEGSNVEPLFASYENWIRSNGVISEFVRFHPMIHNHEKCSSFYDITQLGEVVHMDLKQTDDIWQNIVSKNRNMIRKAIKNNVKVYNGRYPEIFERFREIYNETMDKDNANEYYYFGKDFYRSILEDLPNNAQVFFAEKDGMVISAAIVLFANGKMNYHLSGSVREYNSYAPTNLLLYRAALWGNANGYQSFYLGGGVGSGTDSLFKFKRAFFKGQLNHFYIGKKIYSQIQYDRLTKLRKEISNQSFFPVYRG